MLVLTVRLHILLVYWCMFAVPALSAILSGTRASVRPNPGISLALLLTAFMLLVGLRYEVGGDWFTYEEIIQYIEDESLTESMKYGDVGFTFISWLSTRAGLGTLGPSMLCGAILMYGLWRFSKRLPDPWLVVAAAVPYLIIVVGMGYVRQSAAIGFVLIALIAFEERSLGRFSFWMIMGVLFHVSALCIMPVVAFVIVRKWPAGLVPLGILTVPLYYLLLRPRLDRFYENYVVAEYDSSGAFIRLAMNAVPAVLFFIYRNRYALDDRGRALWTTMSVLALALVVLVVVSPATTAIDRVGLYCIPLQLFVFGTLISVLGRTRELHRLLTFAALGYYAAVLFTWLNYATHAEYWLPYRTVIFG